MKPENLTEQDRRLVISKKFYNKIFCIGYNKTGTTTLKEILRFYGFKVPDQKEQETRLTASCFATNYTEFLNFVPQYDGFQDLPFSQGSTYIVADALFPNSKFILSERNSEEWFDSLTGFHKKVFQVDELSKLTEDDIRNKFQYLYPDYAFENRRRLLASFDNNQLNIRWDKLYDKAYYIEQYEKRNFEIKKYFMNAQEKLLVIDITQESTTEKICDFLNIPQHLAFEMIQENKT